MVEPGRGARLRRAALLCGVCVLVFVGAAVPVAEAAPPALFRVGAAVRSIDPPVPVYSGGFSLSPPITRIRDPLQVRAFFVSNGQHSVAFAVVDAQGYFSSYQEGPDFGITSERADAARAISAAGGPPMGQGDIVIQATHSHAAPTLEGIWGPVPPVYLKEVHDQTVAALVAAAAGARPALLQQATLDDPNIAAVNINQDNYQGWVNDPQISVLRAVSPSDGSTIGVYANVPTHGAHICGQCQGLLSADYFGAVRADLDRLLGGVSVVGPATLGREESPVATTGATNMQWLSGVIANDVLQALGHASWVTDSTVRAAETFVQIPATNAALLGLDREWSLPDSAKQQQAQASGIYPIDRDTAAPYLQGNVLGTYLTALRIGGLAYLSMPGEPFPEIRFALKRATNAGTVVALSKGQDDFGYFYPAFVYPFPETYNSDHAIFNVAPQAGDQIIQSQAANLSAIGFQTGGALGAPLSNDYAQKLRPGLQTLASPPTGDADAGGHFTSTLQAIYMPASVVDAPLAGLVHWDFGDGTQADTGFLSVGQDFGQTGQGQHGLSLFGHAFPVGRHVVKASGVDTSGNPVSWTIPVTVYPTLGVLGACRLGSSGAYVFDGRASGGSGAVLAWRWTFAGGGSASGQTVSHTFGAGAPGAVLSVLDSAGGEASTSVACACVDRRGYAFHLHHPRGQRIVRATVRINGRQVRSVHGRNLKRLTLARLPAGRFTVTIRTLTNRGTRATSVRVYSGCTKTPPRNRFRRGARRRRRTRGHG
jgi:hypothetical protein